VDWFGAEAESISKYGLRLQRTRSDGQAFYSEMGFGPAAVRLPYNSALRRATAPIAGLGGVSDPAPQKNTSRIICHRPTGAANPPIYFQRAGLMWQTTRLPYNSALCRVTAPVAGFGGVSDPALQKNT
jgi:hypothetical protein